MQLIRVFLRAIILFLDRVFSPKPVERPALEQKKIDEQARALAIYEMEACPFCVKVRRHLRRRALPIERRDVKKNREWNKELVDQGGKFQVPCLRIADSHGAVRWLYESDDIIKYLDTQFPN